MEQINALMEKVNSVLWHDAVLILVLLTGIVLTVWSRFAQYRAVTHGFQVLRGRYDDPDDPGAINHFQALSAALSATVGLGNIGGVALAISLGGPGAVFWMWVVGLFGMAIKLTEVNLSMLYRNTDDPDNPHGGPMWVASKGLARMSPALAGAGKFIGGVFCVTLLVSTATGVAFSLTGVAGVGVPSDEVATDTTVAAGVISRLPVGGAPETRSRTATALCRSAGVHATPGDGRDRA